MSVSYTHLDVYKRQLVISRDCRGVILHEGDCFALLSLYLGKGDEKELFEDYFARWSLLRKGAPQCTGWTSWYNYYTNISADIIDENLEVLRRENIAVDVFQIDDGYQKAVGDWLEVNDKFPAGMGAVAGNIRRHGLKPGLWLAPFICEHDSRLFKIKPEWLLRDARGKPVRAGWNPMWSGYFYALDFYADGFRDYLREVFRTVGEEWGFELLKLDFLYGVAILPVSYTHLDVYKRQASGTSFTARGHTSGKRSAMIGMRYFPIWLLMWMCDSS